MRVHLTVAFGLLTVLGGGAIWLRPVPPDAVFGTARTALAAARHAEAATLAPAAMASAEAAWDSALVAWEQENDRWFATRDYARAAAAADEAARLARTATDRAEAVRDSLRAVLATDLPALHAHLARLKPTLDALPYDPGLHAAFAEAEALARRAGRADAPQAAADIVRAAQHRADSVEARTTRLLHGYLAALPTWQRWRDETIAHSARQRAPAIVVDKMARRCYLYVDGRLRAEYPVELGPRWLGDKAHEGDLATPEGRYRITKKLGAGQTIYHRALLLDYPNAEDRHRFEAAKRDGTLPPQARIGGLIELHGHGGRGADWTRGCVALTNPDITALFNAVPAGTPVTLVGALAWPPALTPTHTP